MLFVHINVFIKYNFDKKIMYTSLYPTFKSVLKMLKKMSSFCAFSIVSIRKEFKECQWLEEKMIYFEAFPWKRDIFRSSKSVLLLLLLLFFVCFFGGKGILLHL